MTSKTPTITEVEAAAEQAMDQIAQAHAVLNSCERRLKRRGFSSEESRARLAAKATALLHDSNGGLIWLMGCGGTFRDSTSHIAGER